MAVYLFTEKGSSGGNWRVSHGAITGCHGHGKYVWMDMCVGTGVGGVWVREREGVQILKEKWIESVTGPYCVVSSCCDWDHLVC